MSKLMELMGIPSLLLGKYMRAINCDKLSVYFELVGRESQFSILPLDLVVVSKKK